MRSNVRNSIAARTFTFNMSAAHAEPPAFLAPPLARPSGRARNHRRAGLPAPCPRPNIERNRFMMPPRQIINGMVTCSKCRQPRPVSSFAKDAANALGITYRCEPCRKVAKPRKTVLLLPEPEVVDARDFPASPDSPAKVERGRWERIVRYATILEKGKGLFIPFQGDYYRHHATLFQRRLYPHRPYPPSRLRSPSP